MSQLKNQHLLWRAGFGPMAEEGAALASASPAAYLNALFKASEKKPVELDVADNSIKGLMMGVEEVGKQQRQLSEEQRKKLRQQSRDDIKSLNLAWLNEMVNSEQQLREKMAFFWHGHFASRNLNILYQQQYLSILRRHALGSFSELLGAISKSAAMINFLNNNQNRKGHPNENFAREVMELFTLGRGNYTENDIKEAARAFTGWGADLSGEFVFRKNQHDAGSKTIFGKTGNFDGDDVLNLLLERKETAYWITKKMFRFFVSEEVDEAKVKALANTFYQSNYEISALLKALFSADWFYDKKYIGNKIKSPIELIVGLQRMLPVTLQEPDNLLQIQRLLGQILFYPPNVAGWPGGKSWIDSSSLLLRMRLPFLLYGSEALTLQPKDDDDQQMGMAARLKAKAGRAALPKLGATADWSVFLQRFGKTPKEKIAGELSQLLLQAPLSVPESTLVQAADASSREKYIQTLTLQVMSTPEYQLC